MRDIEANPFLESAKTNFSLDEIVQYVGEKNNSRNALLMGFYDKKSDKHIGNVKLEPLAFDSSYAWFGILIGDVGFRGRGLAREIIDAFLNHISSELGIKQFYLGVKPNNYAARNAYIRCGFKDHGIHEKGGIIMVKEF